MSFTSFFTSVAWYCLQGYTYIEMWYNYYFPMKEEPVEFTEYPFNIVERNGLCQVYYPNLVKTDYSFLQVQIEVDGQKHEIDIKPFMVVGNRLFDRHFTSWILNIQTDLDIDDDDDYTVHIMDHEVNIITLSPKEYIELNKDNYLKKSLDE